MIETLRVKSSTPILVGKYDLDAVAVEYDRETGTFDFRLELGSGLGIYWALPAAPNDRLRLLHVDGAAYHVDEPELLEDPFVADLDLDLGGGSFSDHTEIISVKLQLRSSPPSYRCTIATYFSARDADDEIVLSWSAPAAPVPDEPPAPDNPPEAAVPDDDIERIVGVADSYEILRLVGEGGFGVTHTARRASDGAVVIIKRMKFDRLDSWKALELFEREAEALRHIAHPRIPMYAEFFAVTPDGAVEHTADATHAPSALVLVQEFVDGRDLSRRLAAGESLPPAKLHVVVRQLLEALCYLHELSPPLVHRDVTPKNVVLDANDDAYLVDFGAIQHQLQQSTVGGSTTVGTLGYIPIEQSLGKARPASDLYALGVTTTVLLTGLQPEELPLDDSTGKIDLARLELVPKPSDSVDRKRLLTFVDRAIEPIVGQRLPSARAGLDILDGRDALVVAPVTALEKPPGRARTLFLMVLGGSIGSAAIIYPMNFDNFSETQLVGMAPFWVLPAAFGLIGLMVQHTRRPILNAFLGTIAAGVALVVFLFGIFPSM